MTETVDKVGKLTPLFRWALYAARKVRITSPPPHQAFPVGKIQVEGTVRLRMGGQFVLCHRDGDRYWPHGRLHFHGRHNTWAAEFTLSDRPEKDTFEVVVVELDETAQVLVDYYYTLSKLHNRWEPIRMAKLPAGFTIFDQVTVRRARSAGSDGR